MLACFVGFWDKRRPLSPDSGFDAGSRRRGRSEIIFPGHVRPAPWVRGAWCRNRQALAWSQFFDSYALLFRRVVSTRS